MDPIGHCWYCGIELFDGKAVMRETGKPWYEVDVEVAQKDHVTPKSRGGSGYPHNIVISCRSCNARKNDKTLEEYRCYLLREDEKAEAAEKLLSVIANYPTLPEKTEILRAAGRLLDQVEPITFYGEDNGSQ